MSSSKSPFHLRLPATSANLGPGFDAVALAMSLFLEIEAAPAARFHIEATGRDTAIVASLNRNLMLDTYRDLFPSPTPLQLIIHNQIPLGMGCGSSAAALLAGVILANHFGDLGFTPQQVLEEACRREGHPDNVAACFHGGLTASSMQADWSGQTRITSATLGQTLPWRLLLALPKSTLATSEARALLPATYTRADAIANIQATALLVSAFALDRPDLLAAGTRDRLHQPFRSSACPLLPALLLLASHQGIFSVSLSGAGPSVLLVADPTVPFVSLQVLIREAAADPQLEVLETRIASGISVR